MNGSENRSGKGEEERRKKEEEGIVWGYLCRAEKK